MAYAKSGTIAYSEDTIAVYLSINNFIYLFRFFLSTF